MYYVPKTETNLYRIEAFNFRQEVHFELLKHRLNVFKNYII